MTLGDLMSQFDAAGAAGTTTKEAAPDRGQTKTASGGSMEPKKSLREIYDGLNDLDKTAAAVADAPPAAEPAEADIDFDKVAEQLANEEAAEATTEEDGVMKLAAEYDAAGRLMARGFYSEFNKLAAANQATYYGAEKPSADKNPAIGTKGGVHVETNYEGSPGLNVPMATKGGKEQNAGVLKEKKPNPGPRATVQDLL